MQGDFKSPVAVYQQRFARGVLLLAVGQKKNKKKKKIDPLHQLARLGRLEIHIALSNPSNKVRIGSLRVVAIVSLSLL